MPLTSGVGAGDADTLPGGMSPGQVAMSQAGPIQPSKHLQVRLAASQVPWPAHTKALLALVALPPVWDGIGMGQVGMLQSSANVKNSAQVHFPVVASHDPCPEQLFGHDPAQAWDRM